MSADGSGRGHCPRYTPLAEAFLAPSLVQQFAFVERDLDDLRPPGFRFEDTRREFHAPRWELFCLSWHLPAFQ
jgi:hypothetical protein